MRQVSIQRPTPLLANIGEIHNIRRCVPYLIRILGDSLRHSPGLKMQKTQNTLKNTQAFLHSYLRTLSYPMSHTFAYTPKIFRALSALSPTKPPGTPPHFANELELLSIDEDIVAVIYRQQQQHYSSRRIIRQIERLKQSGVFLLHPVHNLPSTQ